MKKTLSKILGVLILAGVFGFPSALAAFDDVPLAHPNHTAITFLKENNIIHGYPDGNFHPGNKINRVEFLKIILEGSEIKMDALYPTPFPDIDNTDWYAPYVRKAYSEGWIIGYPDGTFRPEQNINKAEAIKILGEVQNWQIPPEVTVSPYLDTPAKEWYTPYISYAKDRSFLEEEGPLYKPAEKITRAQISEVIYRTIVWEEKDSPPKDEPPQDDPPKTNISFEPVDFSLMSKNFFRDITLEEEFPTHFYKDEIYLIEGKLNFISPQKVTVILKNKDETGRKTFVGNTTNGNFSIPVHFSTPGNKVLGIIPGEAGSGTAVQISVFEDTPEVKMESAPPPRTSSSQIFFRDGKTRVEFNYPPNTLKKVEFSQGTEKVKYLVRQDAENIPVQYSDFKNFREGRVEYSVSTAFVSSTKPLRITSEFSIPNNFNFQATQHQFSEIKINEISANPPEVLTSVSPISFSGTAREDLRYNAYVIKPDGFVENVSLSTTGHTYNHYGSLIISAGSTFTYNYTPTRAGTYIVDIYNLRGEPALNHTVYVSTGIPLLPDFFDLMERIPFHGPLNLAPARVELLTLINKERQEHGLPQLVMSNELNSVAQAHSQDMADNNFFGHINLQGQTPEDRRIEAEITTPVGENLAKDTSVNSAHEGLMRSASHRQNLLTPQWTRVGLGIVHKNDHLLITQKFSISELAKTDMENMETELFTEINNLRNANQIPTLNTSTALNSATKFINTKLIEEDAELDNTLFNEALSQNNISGLSKLIGRISTNWSTILESILNEEAEITNEEWKRTGINVQIDSAGNLYTMLILNNK